MCARDEDDGIINEWMDVNTEKQKINDGIKSLDLLLTVQTFSLIKSHGFSSISDRTVYN